jgi:hypothetical protein
MATALAAGGAKLTAATLGVDRSTLSRALARKEKAMLQSA